MMDEKTVHDGVFLIARDDVADYYAHFHPQVLRYDINADTCGYQAVNFGACKGETFNRILIFPNRSFEDFILKGKPLGSPEKYYVAVTRPKYSIAIVLDNLPFFLEGYQTTVICGEGISIPSLQFMPNFEERKK